MGEAGAGGGGLCGDEAGYRRCCWCESSGDGGRAERAGALRALRTTCYVAIEVGGADCGARAAEAGGVEGGACVVVCCAGVGVLAREELGAGGIVEEGGVVVGGCGELLGEAGFEGCEDVGGGEDERSEE